MAWRAPTLKDIAATLSQKELDTYRQSPEFTSGDDPVLDLLRRTAAFVRSKIRRNGQVKMSPDADKIPESLISPAMDYAAYDILKRQPVKMTNERQKARDQAIAEFDKVARRETTPEDYNEDEGEIGKARPKFAPRPYRILD